MSTTVCWTRKDHVELGIDTWLSQLVDKPQGRARLWMKKEDLPNYEHDSGMEQFLSYNKKNLGFRTRHEESVALKHLCHRLKRQAGETMSAWINRSNCAYQQMLEKLRNGDLDANNRASRHS